MRTKARSSRGVTIIEVALFLPVFLMGLFFVIWIGVISNARSALVSAVENGVRLAGTRSSGDLYGKPGTTESGNPGRVGAIQKLHDWKRLGAPALGSRQDLLECTIPDPDDLIGIEKIDNKIRDLFSAPSPTTTWEAGKDKLIKMPTQYAYAMAYVAQSLRLGVSENIKYPCDPNDPVHGDNCLLCRPVNPATLGDEKYDVGRAIPTTDPEDGTILLRRLAIRCDYRPAGFLLKPMMSLMSMVTGGSFGNVGVVSHASYFGRDSNCYIKAGAIVPGKTFPKQYCCNGRCS